MMWEFEAPDWRALHSSEARKKRFRFCPVGYYLYHVPGRDGYGAPPESFEYRIYAAKFQISMRTWVRNLWLESVHNSPLPEKNPRHLKAPMLARGRLEREFGMLAKGEYRNDPKLVPAVTELVEKIYTPEKLYLESLKLLENWVETFERTEWAEFLPHLPQEVFLRDEFLLWQFGGVNFLLKPLMIYRWCGAMVIVDCTHFDSDEARARSAELYRVYVRRFWHIPPEHLEVHFITPETGEDAVNPEAEEPLERFFPKILGEAGMMRDYLERQYDCATFGDWLYPRMEHCGKCRFSAICPAKKGTPEPGREVY